MITKRLTMMLSGVALVLGLAGQAQAMPYQWDIDGIFNDGGTLKGTLTIDHTDLNPIQDYNLTTAGGSWGGIGLNYSPGILPPTFILTNSPTQSAFRITIGFADSTLRLSGFTPSLSQAGPYAISSISEVQRVGFFRKKVVAARKGNAVATPEPGTILLFGSGLAGLGLWRLRKNRKAEEV